MNLTAPVVAIITAIPAVAPVVVVAVIIPPTIRVPPIPTTRHSRVRETPAWHSLPRHRIMRAATVRRSLPIRTISLPPPLTVSFLLVMLIIPMLVLLLINGGARVALPVVVLLKTVSVVVVIILVLTFGWLVNLIEVGGGRLS
jgi:hypothetical protein